MSFPEKAYYRVYEVALYFDLSPTTIYRLINRAELKAIKIRNSWRVNRKELESYARRNRNKARRK